MLAQLRDRAPRASRGAVTGLLVATAVALPGPTYARAPEPLPAFRTVPGTELRPKTPTTVLPVARYRLTGRFGASSSLWSSAHSGLDFAAAHGTAVRAVADGVVTRAGHDGRYGLKLELRLPGGTTVWYCHLSSLSVRPGDRVRAGDRLGRIGSTGNTTGPHLHLEVRRPGRGPVDPAAWLRARGARA